ncbi:MAG: hypothetical protein LQ352_006772 [Teloschistes flavicans]|nr:MAG: hypothetical protein LQ352_006772 [Teloschistes flavicans]
MPAAKTIHEEEVPFVLVPTIPVMKFHGSPFFFMSESGMTQQEFQRNYLAKRACACNSENEIQDDVIVVKCPDREDGTGRHFLFNRSVLKRSPIFAQFFESPHYLHGCNMLLTFMVDPAVCIDIMYRYLEDGGDIYEQPVLRVQLTMRYKLVDRLIILVRLYALAQKMRLPILTAMTFGILNDPNMHINAPDCVTIASLVFAPTAGFDATIRNWCFEHVKECYAELKPSFLWHETMWKTETELPRRWSQFMEEMDARLHASTSPPLDYTPPTTNSSKEQVYQALIDEVMKQQEEDSSNEDDAPVDMPPYPPNRGNAGKIAQLLGHSPPNRPAPPRYSTASAMPAFSPDFNKAHSVMGLDFASETPMKVRSSRRRFSISGIITPSLTPTRAAGQRFKKWAAA